jgi:regulatory protein
VRRRLQRAGVDEATTEAVLARLRQHGVVNDAEFAQYWVEQRQTFRPRGARLLRAELRQHGVDAASAEEAAQVASSSAAEDAYRAGRKRARQLAAAGDQRMFAARLGAFLARRGFGWETIGPVLDRLWRELSAELNTS